MPEILQWFVIGFGISAGSFAFSLVQRLFEKRFKKEAKK